MNGKKMIKLIVFSVAVFGLFGLGTVQAGSLNMTGTWEGFTVCDELKDGVFTYDSFPEPELQISQDGDTLRMSAFGIFYEGKVQEITGSSIQAEAVVSACGGTPETETVRLRITIKGNEGSLDAASIYESDEFFPGLRTFGTCKWHYKRVSTNDPMVLPCGDGN